jgi:hypothetical protein
MKIPVLMTKVEAEAEMDPRLAKIPSSTHHILILVLRKRAHPVTPQKRERKMLPLLF